MTELYLLDGDLSLVYGPIDDYISLVWNERYYACGSYTLTLRMTDAVFKALGKAVFLSVSDRKRLGRIEKRVYSGADGTSGGYAYDGLAAACPNTGGGVLTVSGRMAESLLADRIIARGTRARGELALAVETIVGANACAAAGVRAVAHLTTGEHAVLSDADGNAYTADDAPGGQQLDEWVRKTLSAVGASYRILPDYDTGELVFSVFRGLDRTQAQTENGCAVFSTSFASIGTLDFLADSSDYRNFAYIAGEGEGSQRVIVTLDVRADEGEALRELFVDARDLRSDDGVNTLSEEDYRKLLLTRGKQRLAEHAYVAEVSGTAASYSMKAGAGLSADRLPPVGVSMEPFLRADTDYALGDLCDIRSEALHMSWSERITEICYVYEGTECRVEPRFGTAYPDLKTFIRRMIGKE